MKLNFEYCKTCKDVYRAFGNKKEIGFYFLCWICDCFYFDYKDPDIKKNDYYVRFSNITEEDFKKIKKMNIVKYDQQKFNRCPYQLEHFMGNEE